MKRSLIALAALAFVGAASAQSSVTIFGIVDAVVAVGNGDTANKTRLHNSGYNSSRLGFRGVEDLGGGMKASFHLEGALSNDDGTAGGFNFMRKSVVSLMGSMGELRLGRDYTPNFWSHTVYDPFGTNGVGTTVAMAASAGGGLTGGGATTVRASNSIGYISPSVGGFAVWAQTYFGENASNAASQAGDGSAIRLSYDNGPLSLAAAFSKTTTGAGTDVQTTNFGGSYNMGVAQLMAFWNKDANTNMKDRTGYTLGALVPMGQGTVRLAFSNTDYNGAKTDQFALGYVYDMSKRTAVYGTFASVSNSGNAAYALNGASTPANGSSTGFDLGVRHAF